MGIEQKFSAAINIVGVKAELLRNGEAKLVVISVQPMMNDSRNASPAGFDDNSSFKFYAAFNADTGEILREDEIKIKQKSFFVTKAETVYLGCKPAYIQGLLKKCT